MDTKTIDNALGVHAGDPVLEDGLKITEKDLFRGIDGDFSFENNIIKRNLSILKIQDGKAVLIN